MKHIKPEELSENLFTLIGKKWALLAASDSRKEGIGYNAMTVSWGGAGVLWGKDVFFCFVRPQRYTKEFIDKSQCVTLSFFPDEYRQALALCGRKSGRDCDKIKEAGLNASVGENGEVTFEQARITIVGKKLYASELKPECFIDKTLVAENYPSSDFHTVYVCEITDIEISD